MPEKEVLQAFQLKWSFFFLDTARKFGVVFSAQIQLPWAAQVASAPCKTVLNSRVTILLYLCIYQGIFKGNNQNLFAQTHSKKVAMITKSLTLFLQKKLFQSFLHLRVRNPCFPVIPSLKSFNCYHLQWPEITGEVLTVSEIFLLWITGFGNFILSLTYFINYFVQHNPCCWGLESLLYTHVKLKENTNLVESVYYYHSQISQRPAKLALQKRRQASHNT